MKKTITMITLSLTFLSMTYAGDFDIKGTTVEDFQAEVAAKVNQLVGFDQYDEGDFIPNTQLRSIGGARAFDTIHMQAVSDLTRCLFKYERKRRTFRPDRAVLTEVKCSENNMHSVGGRYYSDSDAVDESSRMAIKEQASEYSGLVEKSNTAAIR